MERSEKEEKRKKKKVRHSQQGRSPSDEKG